MPEFEGVTAVCAFCIPPSLRNGGGSDLSIRSATLPYFRDAIELLPSLALPPVEVLPLDRFSEGLDLYRRGKALKVVFRP